MDNNNTNTENEAKEQTHTQAPPQPQQPPYGYNYQYYPPPPPRRTKSDKPRTAGGLLIVVGILGLIMGVIMMAGGFFIIGDGNLDMVGGQVDISGYVNGPGPDYMPIENATITVQDTHLYVLTNSTGYYQLLGVPGGAKIITIEKEGYNTIERHLFIMEDSSSSNEVMGSTTLIYDDTELSFTLTEGSGTYIYGSEDGNFTIEGMGPLIVFFGFIFSICGIFAIIGGYYALKTQKYALAITGAILGIFSFGFGLGTILAIVALIILLLARDEFKKNGNDQQNGYAYPYPPR